MSEFGPDLDQWQPEFARLESIVRTAGGYVRPTDDLRPNTLEAVQDACLQRRTNFRFGGLAVFIVLLAATGFPGFLFSSHLGPAFVQSSELHRRAAENALQSSVGSHWALYEVFSQLRREQADLLNHSQ